MKAALSYWPIAILVSSLCIGLVMTGQFQQHLPAHALIRPTSTPIAISATANFVEVCGTGLCLNRQPYHIHGATAYGQYANAQNEVALARTGRLNTLEVVKYDHNLADAMSPDTWANVDKFIDQAGKNGIHVILNFSGYGQSLRTAGKNPTDAKYWKPFLDYVANRSNSITGRKYANDPTIMMVEFWGEIDAPHAGTYPGSTGSTTDITNFFKQSAAEWKARDPHHIVSSGGFSYLNFDRKATGQSAGIDWHSIMADPNNQVCGLEINSSEDRDITVPMVSQYCKKMNKPWFEAAWSACYQTGGGDLTNQPDIAGMATHARDMYKVEKGANHLAAMPAIGSDFWNLAHTSANPHTCDLGPQFPSVWKVIQKYGKLSLPHHTRQS